MTAYEILTTQRTVIIEADSPEQAKAIFTRKADPPEPSPQYPGEGASQDQYDAWWAAWDAYVGRWPFLSWQHGEGILGKIREHVPDGS